MKNVLLKSVCLTVLMLLAGTVAFADLKMKSRMTMGPTSFESTTYIKGERQRTETEMMGMSTVQITQCDLKRMIQINDNLKKYLITPIEDVEVETAGKPSPRPRNEEPSQSTRTRKGGIVTMTITTRDTGERKEMFGYTARHIIMTMETDSTPDACNPQKMKMEIDGWYINFAFNFNCSKDKPPVPTQYLRGRKPDCQDTFRFKTAGGYVNPGYAVIMTMTMSDGSQQGMTMKQEVLDLSKAELDPALFDIPAGYAEARSQEEMVSRPSIGGMIKGARRAAEASEANEAAAQNAPEGKRPGTIRVGVAPIGNKAGATSSLSSLRSSLVANISGSGVEAVALGGPDYEGEAKQKECDYILYTDLSDLKKPSGKAKLGGMLGRATGVGGLGGGGKFEARVDFRLVPIGSSSPVVQSSETAKEDGDETAAISSALSREARAVVSGARKK